METMNSPRNVILSPSRRYQQANIALQTPTKTHNRTIAFTDDFITVDSPSCSSPTSASIHSPLTPMSPNVVNRRQSVMFSPSTPSSARKSHTSNSHAIYTPSYYKNVGSNSARSPKNLVMNRKAHKLLIGGSSPQQHTRSLDPKNPLSPIRYSPLKRSSPKITKYTKPTTPLASRRRTTIANGMLKRASSEPDTFFQDKDRKINATAFLSKSSSISNLKASRTPATVDVIPAKTVKKTGSSNALKPKVLFQRVKALKKKKKQRLSDSSKLALAQDFVGPEAAIKASHLKRPDSPTNRFSPLRLRENEGTIADLHQLLAQPASLTITNVLYNEYYRNVFYEFCKRELSTENIDFWIETWKFEKWTNKCQRLIHAKRLYNDYISPDAPNSLNIDMHAVHRIRDKIISCETQTGPVEETLVGLFQALRTTIEVCMNDTFHRFKGSNLYRDMLMGQASTIAAHPVQQLQQQQPSSESASSGCTIC